MLRNHVAYFDLHEAMHYKSLRQDEWYVCSDVSVGTYMSRQHPVCVRVCAYAQRVTDYTTDII